MLDVSVLAGPPVSLPGTLRLKPELASALGAEPPRLRVCWKLPAHGAASAPRPQRRAPAGGDAARAAVAGTLSVSAALASLSLAPPALAAERLFPPLRGGGGRGGGGGGGGGGAAAGARGGAARAGRPGVRRVLILMSDTGGGHRASAEALKAAFESDGFQVTVVDLWSQDAPWPTNNLPKSYSFLVKHGWLWRLNFQFSSLAPVHHAVFGAYGALVSRSFAAAFDRHDPHLVVSVHPLMQHIPLRVLAQRARAAQRKRGGGGGGAAGGAAGPAPRPAFATVVTDLTRCHPTWFHKGVDACFVPTASVAHQAAEQGLLPHQIVLHGLPVRPAFAVPLPGRVALRRSLGLPPAGFTVLLMGGGEGMGALEATAAALSAALPPSAQLCVVCGRNEPLRRRLASRAFSCGVHALGFVSNVDQWMGASDVVVTKAGPGTIAEALIRGLPLLLNGAIPCQEEGNVPYVVDAGVGRFEAEPGAIARTIAHWASPAGAPELAAMAARARALGRPRATFDIVKDLAAMAQRSAGTLEAAAAAAA